MHAVLPRSCDYPCGLRSLVQHAIEQAEVPHSTTRLLISIVTA